MNNKILFFTKDIDKFNLNKYYYNYLLNKLNNNLKFYVIDLNKYKNNISSQNIYHNFNIILNKSLYKDIQYIFITDPHWFKKLTKQTNLSLCSGNIFLLNNVLIKTNSKIFLIYLPSYKNILLKPNYTRYNIKLSLNKFINHYLNKSDIKKNYKVIYKHNDKINILKYLLKLNQPLSIDIETFSLNLHEANIYTIAFAWNSTIGIAFQVDIDSNTKNIPIRNALKEFFIKFNNNLIYHNISFDVTILIYNLFMKGLEDQSGLLTGLNVMLKNWHCTKLITYLATNSCEGNNLSLKYQAKEYLGLYALKDIKNIQEENIHNILKYNIQDCLATYYVFNKNYSILLQDNQEDIYLNIFKPAIKDIIQMQLTGLPLNKQKVDEFENYLLNRLSEISDIIHSLSIVKNFLNLNNLNEFKFNSTKQVIEILYSKTFFNLPIIDKTPKNFPSINKETLKKLIKYTSDKDIIQFLSLNIEYIFLKSILSNFIKYTKNSIQGINKNYYLIGYLNLGGTRSGRLSSSNPNLQNLPSSRTDEIGIKIIKTLKDCIQAPPGWIFCGVDFDALEDKISALLTKDPNKLKVYEEGYDGHCLRTFNYYPEHFKHIELAKPSQNGYYITLENNSNIYTLDKCKYENYKNITEYNYIEYNRNIINNIKNTHSQLRFNSKTVTFAFTYLGTAKTVSKDENISLEQAEKMYENYHKMYKVSDNYVNKRIYKAYQDGYINIAFNLKLRTTLLKYYNPNLKNLPYSVQKEIKTASNALGQSWGLLNTRASSEFLSKVRNSKYCNDIKPCVHIHDAQYYLVRNNLKIIHFINEELIKSISWQSAKEIKHDKVKISGSLSIFYPSWAYELKVQNNISLNDLRNLIKNYKEKLKND